VRRSPFVLLSTALLGACGTDEKLAEEQPVICESSVRIAFVADAPAPGEEAYVCFGFDAGLLEGRPISGIRWFPPAGGGVSLHHATLFATREDAPDGPAPCASMPADAVALHVFAPGGIPLGLKPGIGVELPSGTRRLLVEAHALRLVASAPESASAEICTLAEPPAHLAAWLGVTAPVPAIRPRHEEQSIGRCRLEAPLRLISTWPHMHRVGKAFHGSLLRLDGSRTPLIDVAPWDFEKQRTYPLDVQAGAGEVVETRCIWQNPGDEYVLPGILTSNEMCNQGLLGWPAEAARCAVE
jgi:hypothetical protein